VPAWVWTPVYRVCILGIHTLTQGDSSADTAGQDQVSRWRPPLRIAWRTARRSPGRTALIAALIGVPVLAAAFADTFVHTNDLSPQVRASRELGTADALLTITDRTRVTADPTGGFYPPQDSPTRDPATVALPDLLPAGSRIVAAPASSTAVFTLPNRKVTADARGLHTESPLTAGLVSVRSGRLPVRAGEVGLTPMLADRLGTSVGGTIRPDGGAPATVVGLIGDPDCRKCDLAVGLPGWAGPAPRGAGVPGENAYLVDFGPPGTGDQYVQGLADHGIGIRLRDVLVHPEHYLVGDTYDKSGPGLALVILGIGLLEVTLLAGAAFAVGARRQVHDAALVLANGGRRADVRRMVLAQGIVLGLLGSVGGAVLGVLALPVAWGRWQDLAGKDFAGLVVSTRELVMIVLIETLVSVLAAVVPAISAGRVPVLAGLAGKYGRPAHRQRRRLAGTGAALVGGGLVAATVASAGWRRDLMPHGPGYVTHLGRESVVLTLGLGLATIGLAMTAPGLVGLLGRLAHRLPLTARLAVRDAARQRHRTGPAVAAVMVAVTGTVALAQVLAGFDAHDRAQYAPRTPIGSALLTAGSDTEPGPHTNPLLLPSAHAAALELPSTGEVPIPLLDRAPDHPAGDPNSDADVGEAVGLGDVPQHCDSPYASSFSGVSTSTEAAVLQAGDDNAARARAALAAGQAVITTPCLTNADGRLPLLVYDKPVNVAAVTLIGPRYWGLPSVFVSERTGATLGLRAYTHDVLITTDRTPTAIEVDKARGQVGTSVLEVEEGYGRPYLPGLVGLIAGAAIITLGGVTISVSLSAAESRADLATLAAVGAGPRLRRALAACQAGLVGGVGVLLGGALGMVTGMLVLHSQADYPLAPPWPTLAAICLAVPLLGIAVVTLTTRSRLPMIRRLG
jgi:putative ABC transport system permease protein